MLNAEQTAGQQNYMRDADRAFIQDMVYFTYMNRVASAYSLYESFNNPNSCARFVIDSMSPDFHDKIRDGDLQIPFDGPKNYLQRIKAVMMAKIFAEQFSSYEDLGALCLAIKYRKKKDIFKSYFDSSLGQVDSFFKDIQKSENENILNSSLGLQELLDLPAVSILKNADLETKKSIQKDYEELPLLLKQVADEFCSKISPQQLSSSISSKKREEICVVLGMSENPKEIELRIAFNKIKHRFMISENIEEYSKDPNLCIQLGRFSLEQEDVKQRINSIIFVSRAMAEIAALILCFDENSLI